MWDFATQLLKEGGVAVVVTAMIVGLNGYIVRHLWQANTALHAQLRTLQTDYTDRLIAVQERRVDEAKQITTEVVMHSAKVAATMEKLQVALDMLGARLRRD